MKRNFKDPMRRMPDQPGLVSSELPVADLEVVLVTPSTAILSTYWSVYFWSPLESPMKTIQEQRSISLAHFPPANTHLTSAFYANKSRLTSPGLLRNPSSAMLHNLNGQKSTSSGHLP